MEQTNTAPKRPTFLTVLCILTWVGSVWAIISLFLGKAAVSMASGMAEGMSSVAEGAAGSSPELSKAMEDMNSAVSNYDTYMYIGIACALLCIVGAVMMWQLKKMGFYVYVVGELVAPILGIVLLGSSAMAGAMAVLGMIIPVVFVVLYGLNLKHMK